MTAGRGLHRRCVETTSDGAAGRARRSAGGQNCGESASDEGSDRSCPRDKIGQEVDMGPFCAMLSPCPCGGFATITPRREPATVPPIPASRHSRCLLALRPRLPPRRPGPSSSARWRSFPGGDSMEKAMKPHETSGEIFLSLLRWRLIWAVVAGVVAATGWSWLMSWCAGLPRVSDVSLAAAAERGNTPSTWLATFAVSACAAFLLQWWVRSLISLLIRFCRRGPERGTR